MWKNKIVQMCSLMVILSMFLILDIIFLCRYILGIFQADCVSLIKKITPKLLPNGGNERKNKISGALLVEGQQPLGTNF